MEDSKFPTAFRRSLSDNSFFSPVHRVFYLATPKVACTSLKWWFADLVGFSEAIHKSVDSQESDSDLVIHDSFLKAAPLYTGRNEDGLARAMESSDFFKFCVVRNPYRRVFSAWQSKWLLSEHLQVENFDAGDANLDAMETFGCLRDMFESFLGKLTQFEGSDWPDVHLAPQATLLEPSLLDYDLIARIENLAPLERALSAHLGSAFRSPFGLKRKNVSLLDYSPSWISDKSKALIRKIYSRDFNIFGYSEEVPEGAKVSSREETELALRAVTLIRARNQRLGCLLKSRPHRNSKAHHAMPRSEMRLYFSELVESNRSEYSEKRSVGSTYYLTGQRQTAILLLPKDVSDLTSLRIDPSNSLTAVIIQDLTWINLDGTEVWRWDGGISLISNIAGIYFVHSPDGLIMLSTCDDSHFELALPPDILTSLRGGSSLRVEFTPHEVPEFLEGAFKWGDRTGFGLEKNSSDSSSPIFRSAGNSVFLSPVPSSAAFKEADDLEIDHLKIRPERDKVDEILVEDLGHYLLQAEAQLKILSDVLLWAGVERE